MTDDHTSELLVLQRGWVLRVGSPLVRVIKPPPPPPRAFITHHTGFFWWEGELARARGDRDLLRDLLELGPRATWGLRKWA